jgi:HtrA serine peptidase 2
VGARLAARATSRALNPRALATAGAAASAGACLACWGPSAGQGGPRAAALCEGAAAPRDLRQHFRYFIADAVEKAAGSVVKITCEKESHWYTIEEGGSGFIFDENSILTNAHVVQGAKRLTVTLRDGTELPGQVECLDSLSDVAIVRVDAASNKLPQAKLGSSGDLRVGEWVVAMGSPGGHLKDSVTLGIVSALLRASSELGMSARRMTYIQTDAAINHGNSGGPIVNTEGQVVGISTMKAAHLDGVGFAIPIDLAMDMVRQMRAHGKVLRPYLGLKMVPQPSPSHSPSPSASPSPAPS